MKDALHIAAIWTHILGIALFVGPQFFLAFAWVPASREIEDLPTRVRAMRTITRRFAWVGGIGLLLILLAGGYLIGSWRDYYALTGNLNDYYFGVVFSIKMAVLVVMLIVVGVHTFVVGPKLLEVYEAKADGKPVADADLSRARRNSMILSITGLVLVLAIMVMGAMLTTTTFSLRTT